MCLPFAVLLEAGSGAAPESSFTDVVCRCLGNELILEKSAIYQAYE